MSGTSTPECRRSLVVGAAAAALDRAIVMEAVSAYQAGCLENDVRVNDYVVRMLQAGPAHLHLAGRARVRALTIVHGMGFGAPRAESVRALR